MVVQWWESLRWWESLEVKREEDGEEGRERVEWLGSTRPFVIGRQKPAGYAAVLGLAAPLG